MCHHCRVAAWIHGVATQLLGSSGINKIVILLCRQTRVNYCTTSLSSFLIQKRNRFGKYGMKFTPILPYTYTFKCGTIKGEQIGAICCSIYIIRTSWILASCSSIVRLPPQLLLGCHCAAANKTPSHVAMAIGAPSAEIKYILNCFNTI